MSSFDSGMNSTCDTQTHFHAYGRKLVLTDITSPCHSTGILVCFIPDSQPIPSTINATLCPPKKQPTSFRLIMPLHPKKESIQIQCIIFSFHPCNNTSLL